MEAMSSSGLSDARVVTVHSLSMQNGSRVQLSHDFTSIAKAAEDLKKSVHKYCITGLTLRLSGSNVSPVDISTILSLDLPNIKLLRLMGEPPAPDMYDYHLCFDMEPYPTSPGTDFEDLVRAHEQSSSSPFSYDHLLLALARWSTLEVVQLVHFLHIPSKDPYNLPRFPYPLCVKDLKKFEIWDLPSRMQFFLGYMRLPVSVAVHLRATTGVRPLEAVMLQDMVPQQPIICRYLEMRTKADQVCVEVGPHTLLVSAAAPSQHPSLIMQVLPTSAGAFDAHDARGDLLRSTLRLLPGIFNSLAVTDLRICGDITWIRSRDDWVDILQPFRNLKLIILRDYVRGEQGSAGPFFEGLAVDVYDVQERRNIPVCPRLRALRVTDVCVSRDLIHDMYKGLEKRQARGFPVSILQLELRVSKLAKSKLEQGAKELSGVVGTIKWHDMRTLTSYVHNRSS